MPIPLIYHKSMAVTFAGCMAISCRVCGKDRPEARPLRREPAMLCVGGDGGVAEWSIAAVLKTVEGSRPPGVRIPPPPPFQNRTVNAGRSRLYARGGGEGLKQIALRSHDPDLLLRDFDALGERAEMVATIVAALDPHAFPRCSGEFPSHLRWAQGRDMTAGSRGREGNGTAQTYAARSAGARKDGDTAARETCRAMPSHPPIHSPFRPSLGDTARPRNTITA